MKKGCYYDSASEALAQKLGFTNRQAYPVNYIHVKKEVPSESQSGVRKQHPISNHV